MRAFILFCLVAASSAGRPGYNYNAGSTNSIDGSGSGVSGVSGPVSYNAPAQVEYHKEFFSFQAKDDDFVDQEALRNALASVKKNIRVIFIKSPENRGYENAVLALAKQAAQQQTAIYLLHRQPDIGELANKFNAIRNDQNKKPEVHFVKYRTPEDAANAQRAIQSQYDQLGGSSQHHNGGVASAINFASRSSAPAHVSQPQAPQSEYLPSAILRRLRLRR